MARKKNKIIVQKGKIYIKATFNNTLITITDESGKPFITGSCGMYGFSGTRKSTPYAATTTADSVIRKAIGEHGLKEADVYIKGIGPGRGAVLRVIKSLELEVNRIIDTTPVPHNGVRPPKIRRV